MDKRDEVVSEPGVGMDAGGSEGELMDRVDFIEIRNPHGVSDGAA